MSDLILTDQNFSEEVLKSQKPILVDFWAEWCVPCQVLNPILQELAEEIGEKVRMGKIDIDKNPLVSATFSIDAIPALILFKDGKAVKKLTGVQPKKNIIEAIESVIDK